MVQPLLRGPRRALLTPDVAAGWTPFDLGADLLGYWDASRLDTITLSGTNVASWRDLVAGYDAVQAVGAARPQWSPSSFGGYLNKNANTNSNPQSTAGITLTGADPASASIVVVDDSAALAAVGLSAYGPNVFKLDNSAGTANVFAQISPSAQIIAGVPYQIVAWVRGGAGQLRNSSLGSEGATAFPASPTYSRQSAPQLTAANRTPAVVALTGQTIYFTLNGVYEGSSPPPVDVVVQGAAAWGYGAPGVIFDGVDDLLSLVAALPFPTGSSPGEMWALTQQDAPPSDATGRSAYGYGTGTGTTARRIIRSVDGGVNRMQTRVGDGATIYGISNSSVVATGRHVVRGIVSATDVQTDVDGVAGSSTAGVPATGATTLRIGATDGGTNFWLGQHAVVALTNPLSAPNAANFYSYLNRRGGI